MAEHDFVLQLWTISFRTIDDYDSDMMFGSDDPADPKMMVAWIMFAISMRLISDSEDARLQIVSCVTTTDRIFWC